MVRPLLLAILVAALFAAACAPGAAPAAPASGTQSPAAPAAMTFMAGFKTQANLPFVAAYLADSKGYFRDENLDVTIQHSAGNAEHFTLLATGRIQASTSNAADLVRRISDPGLPLVAVALFGQQTDQAFVTLANSGIRTPKDWEGRIVGYKGSPSADYLAILAAAGVDRSRVREVSVGFDPRVLTEGRVDVYPVFEGNEPFLIRRLGFEPNLVRATDFGVTSLGLTYIMERSWLQQNPGVAERFLRATLRGARHAVANPEEAVAEVIRRAPQEDPDQQRYLLQVEIANALQGLRSAADVGSMNREQWQRQIAVLRDFGVAPNPVSPEAVFDAGPLQRALGR